MTNRISVAMCTYNGAAYLAEQLASIAGQTQLPDELVICDDRSTDATAEIVHRFAASAPFEVHFEVNKQNLGSRANFAKAIQACRADWILLADQDDVWMPRKVQTLAGEAAGRTDVGFLFSDAVVVDSSRRSLGYTLWNSLRFSKSEQRRMNAGDAFELLLRRNVVTGATMMFRAEHRDWLLPIDGHWVHDGWIALLIAAVAGVVAVGEPLIEYRQHPNQQIGATKRTIQEDYRRVRSRSAEHFEAIAADYAAARARLMKFRRLLRHPQSSVWLDEKIEHFRAKAQMRTSSQPRVPAVLRELLRFHYLRYSTGWRSLAQDLFA
jgi:glycosyltransferase involved in cell wall biosynthesis